MSLVLLLAFQSAPSVPAAPPAPAPAPAAPLAVEFDLAEAKPADRCYAARDGSEILVCGRRPSTAFDLEKWARVYERGPLRAEKGIAPGVIARVYTDSAPMPGGAVSKRAMVGVKVKF